MPKDDYLVAYLSLEIGLEGSLHTYAGGLGVLAGDTLRSAANMNFPMVGISLLNRHGYFKQSINAKGEQIASRDRSIGIKRLKRLSTVITVPVKGRSVRVGVWRYNLVGPGKFLVPVYFLDANQPENNPSDRHLTDDLYGGDAIYRLKQEIILGRGGLMMLERLGYKNIKRYHLNEAHSALAAAEVYRRLGTGQADNKIQQVRNQLIFTTHTPLYQDQDVFTRETLLRYQPDFPIDLIKPALQKGRVSFIALAAFMSGKINAVSKLHQQVSQRIFAQYKIKSVTNGVNSSFWTCPEFSRLFDHYLPGWRVDPSKLSRASCLPLGEVWQAHQEAKNRLIALVKKESGTELSPDVLTIVFARRFATYKQPLLIFSDLRRLLSASRQHQGIQMVYAGKAHPHDRQGQALISRLRQIQKELGSRVKLAFIIDYDLDKARILTAGADVWLNTPQPPQEASGTSGMKAAHNGVPQLSTADGWWLEGYRSGKTGWLINDGRSTSLYRLLQDEILPTYYQEHTKWQQMMRQTIMHNAAVFNSDRMLKEYINKMYKI